MDPEITPTPVVDPIEVIPSDNGEPEAPKVEPVAPPKEETVPPTDPPAEPELFELPDGRKVDASTLSKEWKENFYPEYTRKSQELAKVKTGEAPITTETPKPVVDSDWVPQTYAEIVEKAKLSLREDLAREEKERVDSITAVENQVTEQLTAVKTADPTVNENALFQHAMKYGFRDLRLAHQNMKDMAGLVKDVKQSTAKDIAKRNDPVSVIPGATGGRPDPSQFSTARDYLRSLKT